MRNVEGFPKISVIKEIRGQLAEEKVRIILEELENEGKIWQQGLTFRFSEDDRRGIDGYIYLQPGVPPVLLQVKSHFSGEIEGLEIREVAEGIWYKGGIYTIEVPPEEEEEKIREKILEILEIEKERRKHKKQK